ncbi:hypothetical protein MHU86_13415 [Fragilaria crotonensis]|nr:hypothetical protein MHU86_13415 [Fragilaria crotonensis]
MQAAPELWTVDEMNKAMERKESEYNYGKIDVDIIDPGKCQTDFGWDNWQIAFVNKLNATMGAAKVPSTTSHMTVPQTAGRRGRPCCPLRWDRELNKRVEAKEELARLHYKDEKIFPFEKYVTKLKENFFVLEKDKHEELTAIGQQTPLRKRHGNQRSTRWPVVRVRVVADLASVPAAEVDKAVVAVVAATNVARMRTMLTSPTLIGTLRPTNGNGSDQCDHTSYNCVKAVVEGADVATVTKTTAMPIGQPAVLRRTTMTTALLTTAATETMSRPTTPLSRKLLSVVLRTAGALAVVRITIPETRMPLLHVMCKR